MAPSRFLLSCFLLVPFAASCEKRTEGVPAESEIPALQRYDANKDGQLSEEERTAMNREFVGRFDEDKDGKLSVAERETARKLGKVTVKPAKREISAESAANLVSALDRNQDGGISKDEVDEKRWKAISRADQDGDGRVTAEEWRNQGGK